MACISKVARSINYDCDTGATGLSSALIINKADISSFSIDNSTMQVLGLTLVAGTKPYVIDTVKRSLVISSALKVNEGAPNAYSHSASIVFTRVHDSPWRTTMQAFSNGSFVIITRPADGSYPRVYGLYHGLSATAAGDQTHEKWAISATAAGDNTHENGAWATITLETPENTIGEDHLAMGVEEYDTLYKAAAAG
jgi:hypothetical protein